jgi:hypothetical protein
MFFQIVILKSSHDIRKVMSHNGGINFQFGKWLASPSEGEEVVISGEFSQSRH